MDSLSDLLNAFVLDDVSGWQVVKDPDVFEQDTDVELKTENFNPLTLLNSFFESEIELDSAIKLFDSVLQRLKKNIIDNTLDYKTIHLSVVEELLNLDHKNAVFWLSNYENIFGPTIDKLDNSDKYINARNARELKQFIIECLDLDEESEYQYKKLDSNHVRAVTNRLIKLIRYCGFYKVKKEFLRAFIDELSERSVKGFIPTRCMSREDASFRLDDAERSFILALDNLNQNKQRSINVINVALEDVGAVFLSFAGMLPASVSRSSFNIFCSHLDTLCALKELPNNIFPALPGIQGAKKNLEQNISQYGIDVVHLKNLTDDIRLNIKNSYYRQALSLSLNLLKIARALLYQDCFFNFISTNSDDIKVSSDYKECLIAHLNSLSNLHSARIDRLGVEWKITYSLHSLMDYGRRVLFIFVNNLSIEEMDAFNWTDVSLYLEKHHDAIPTLVVSRGIGGAFYENYKSLVIQSKRCVSIVYKEHLESHLMNRLDIRDLIASQFRTLVPESDDWENGVFNAFDLVIPKDLTQIDMTYISAEILTAFKHSLYTQAAIAAAKYLETRIKAHALLIYSVLKHKTKGGIVANTEFDSWDLYKIVSWFSSVGQLKSSGRGNALEELLPSKKNLSLIDALRRERNELLHEGKEYDSYESKRFIDLVLSIINDLSILESGFKCQLAVDNNKKWYQFDGDRFQLVIAPGNLTKINAVNNLGAYCKINEKNRQLIPAHVFCKRCNEPIYVVNVSMDSTIKCRACNTVIHIEKIWGHLSKSLRKVEKIINSSEPEAISKLGEHGKEKTLNTNDETLIYKQEIGHKNRKSVFISYSHADEDWLKRLLVHLKPLERNGVIDIWSDKKIATGQKWKSEINKALRLAKVAILLISADFMASDFIVDVELSVLLEAAENEGVQICPIILKPSRYLKDAGLSKFQSLNDPKKPLIGLSEVEQEAIFVKLTEAIESIV